jgi:sugar O-acyltransferase (sialic acid O-acetyltransferase NeuD family)
MNDSERMVESMRVVLLGGGGHALDILGLISEINQSFSSSRSKKILVAGILADDAIDLERFSGLKVPQLGTISDLGAVDATHYIIAIGSSQERQNIHRRIQTDLTAASLVHPSTMMGFGCTYGEGTVIFGGTRLSPKCTIGKHVHISYGVLVGHETSIGNFSSVYPGANISGNVSLGKATTAGTGSTIIEKIVVNDNAFVAAGAVVIRDVPHGVKVMGVPAKAVSKHSV